MVVAKRERRFKSAEKYLFLFPAFLIYISVVIYPVFYSLFLSFFEWNGVASKKKVFRGLDNYFALADDRVFVTALKNNALWILMTLCFVVVIALLFALLLNNRFRFNTTLRGILYFPYVMSGVMVATTWNWIYHPQLGLINSLLKMIGLGQYQVTILANSDTALIGVFVAGAWHFIGQPMVLFLSGLQTIPSELIESSKIDGSNSLQSFMYIKLPLLKETIFVVFATQIISCMKIYDIVYCMTGGGPAESTQTLATWMVINTFNYSKVGYGMAISWVMVFIMMFIIIPYIRYQAKDR